MKETKEELIQKAIDDGATVVNVPDDGRRVTEEDIKFDIGDRVKTKQGHEGTIARIPKLGSPIITLGPHELGLEYSVDMDGDRKAVTVGKADEFEKI